MRHRVVLTFAREFLERRGLAPLLLLKAPAARRALRPAGVVLASADQLVRHIGVLNVASVRVPVAHTPTADTDVLDRVEVLRTDSTCLKNRLVGHIQIKFQRERADL